MVTILICLGLFGAGLIAIPPYFIHGTFEGILGDFGIAILIASILGMTVERYTKQRFTKELARDVFEATIGHMLPKEFQDEMRSIYTQKAMCEDHVQIISLKKDAATDLIRFECQIVRRIRNITGEDTQINLGVGIDEWFELTPSCISEFEYQVEGEGKITLQTSDLSNQKLEKGRPTLSVTPQTVKVPKEKAVTVWTTTVEIKPLNSDHHAHFTYPTKNPKVQVLCDEGIEAVVAFPHETEKNKMELSVGRYQFDGLVRAGQEIRIRWWERDELAKWLKSSS